MKPKDSSSELFAREPNLPQETDLQNAPLAMRMRPKALDDIAGQEHLLAEGKILRRTLQADRLSSLILYGPPGTGKTTLARVISATTKSHFISLNAVTSNVADLRSAIETAQKLKKLQGTKTLLFVDEIHRFNKAQQDALMPSVEEGLITLIGATTQNPSFAINGPLLSRALILELRPLTEEVIVKLLKRALQDPEKGFGKIRIHAEDEALWHIAKVSSGDARRALNALEIGILTAVPDKNNEIHFDLKAAEESCQRKVVYHDKEGDYHYDLASAFIKSMRGSDPDASIYWLAKMLYGGEDLRFIARRILILASEDIGNADPQALILAASGLQAIEFVGMPEAQIILGQLVTYMALAPKSNASYLAISQAMNDLQEQKTEEVPNHLRDSHYPGAKRMEHGKGYQYVHDFPGHYVEQVYGPQNAKYYEPTAQGFEKTLQERLAALRKPKKS